MKRQNRSDVSAKIIACIACVLIVSNGAAQVARETEAFSKAWSAFEANLKNHKNHKTNKPISEFKYEVAKNFSPLSFEKLGGFQIEVQWLMNPTNSAADILKRLGEIPAQIRAFDGKKVSIAGYMKPIKQDSSGATEFLLVPDYFTCCVGKLPVVNQWVHVVTLAKPITLVGDRPLAIRGVLRVGEKLAGSNVVSIYRLEDVEVELISNTQ